MRLESRPPHLPFRARPSHELDEANRPGGRSGAALVRLGARAARVAAVRAFFAARERSGGLCARSVRLPVSGLRLARSCCRLGLRRFVVRVEGACLVRELLRVRGRAVRLALGLLGDTCSMHGFGFRRSCLSSRLLLGAGLRFGACDLARVGSLGRRALCASPSLWREPPAAAASARRSSGASSRLYSVPPFARPRARSRLAPGKPVAGRSRAADRAGPPRASRPTVGSTSAAWSAPETSSRCPWVGTPRSRIIAAALPVQSSDDSGAARRSRPGARYPSHRGAPFAALSRAAARRRRARRSRRDACAPAGSAPMRSASASAARRRATRPPCRRPPRAPSRAAFRLAVNSAGEAP